MYYNDGKNIDKNVDYMNDKHFLIKKVPLF